MAMGMPAPSGRLSEASTQKWHGGEDEDNPRFREPMRLAIEEKKTQREHAAAKLHRETAYTRAVAAFASVGTWVLGAGAFALGSVVAVMVGLPGWAGGVILTVVGVVLYTLGFPMRASREFLAAVHNEEQLKDKVQQTAQEIHDKQRLLDESVKIVDVVELPQPLHQPAEKMA